MNLPWLLFSFKGRIGRLAYFAIIFAVAMTNFGLWRVLLRLIGESQIVAAKTLPPEQALPFLLHLLGQHALVFFVATVLLWINLAAIAKRLHDIGKSAWWIVFQLIAPIAVIAVALLGLLMKSSAVGPICLVVGGVTGLYNLWLGLQLLFRAGDNGINDHGAPGAPPGDGSAPEGEPSAALTAAMASAVTRAGGGAPRPAAARLAVDAPRSSFGRR